MRLLLPSDLLVGVLLLVAPVAQESQVIQVLIADAGIRLVVSVVLAT